MRRAQVLRYWVPALCWSILLLWFSGTPGSSSHSEAMLGWLLTALFERVAPETLELINLLMRKATHLTAYGIAGALNFRAIRSGRSGWTSRWSVIAFTLAVIAGSLDEWHQTMVPGRTGMIDDVALDAAGAAIALLLWRFFASAETSARER